MSEINHIKLLYFMRRLKMELNDHFLHSKCIKIISVDIIIQAYVLSSEHSEDFLISGKKNFVHCGTARTEFFLQICSQPLFSVGYCALLYTFLSQSDEPYSRPVEIPFQSYF